MTVESAFLLKRELSGEFVVDTHLHSGNISTFITGEFSQVLAHLRHMGTAACIVSDTNEYEVPCENNGNVRKLARENEGFLFGAIYINPNRTKKPADMENELDICAKSKLFTGIKLHPVWNGRQVDDSVYFPVYKAAAALGFPILIHTWGCGDIHRLESIALKFPKTCFIAGHCGGELDASLLAGETAARLENFYLDFTCSWAYANLLEYLVQKAGAHKILFGSDALWNSFDASIGRVVFAEISDAAKRDILGLNAKKLFPELTFINQDQQRGDIP